jgi:hypothetical protein
MQIKRVLSLLLLAGALVPSALAQIQRVEMRVEGMT